MPRGLRLRSVSVCGFVSEVVRVIDGDFNDGVAVRGGSRISVSAMVHLTRVSVRGGEARVILTWLKSRIVFEGFVLKLRGKREVKPLSSENVQRVDGETDSSSIPVNNVSFRSSCVLTRFGDRGVAGGVERCGHGVTTLEVSHVISSSHGIRLGIYPVRL